MYHLTRLSKISNSTPSSSYQIMSNPINWRNQLQIHLDIFFYLLNAFFKYCGYSLYTCFSINYYYYNTNSVVSISLVNYIHDDYICFISWLYTEHRKDRMLKEQKELEAAANHKSEDSADHNSKISNLRIINAQKSTQKTEMMNGIDNVAFESEQLWSHDTHDAFFSFFFFFF